MKKTWILIILFALAIVTFAVTPLVGMKVLSIRDVLAASGTLEADIFWKMRLPRVCTSFLAGLGLAISGMALQAMFRNPLATPFTLGIAGGASFGTALYVLMGMPFAVLGVSGVSVFAFFGALLSILLVYGLTMARRGFSTATMLLAGVAVSFFFSSLILFLQYLSDFTQSFRILRWLMGGFEMVDLDAVLNVLPFVAAGSAIVLYLSNDLNLLTTGEDVATSRGVDVKRVKRTLFFATSLMVGGVVAICGPIGFVGMMVPHICRLIIGPDHRYLAPATILFGGTFLTICDAVSRTLIAPAEIPVGIITAMLGGPFFIYLLLKGSSEQRIV